MNGSNHAKGTPARQNSSSGDDQKSIHTQGSHKLDDDGTCQHDSHRLSSFDTDGALSMAAKNDAGFLTKTEGTYGFWSPEMCDSKPFSGYAADMWAAGVCLYIFSTGKLPFYNDIPTDLFDIIREAKVPYEGLGLSNTLIDLLKVTMHKDPSVRAGVGDCLKHPFLQVAREKRIRQLSTEFERSRKRKLIVSEEDIRKVRMILFVNTVCTLEPWFLLL